MIRIWGASHTKFKCPYKRRIIGMWNNSPHPYTALIHKLFLDRMLHVRYRAFWIGHISHRTQWGNISFPTARLSQRWWGFLFTWKDLYICQRIWCKLNAYPATFGIIVLFRVEAGANSWVFTSTRSFWNHMQANENVLNSRSGFLNHGNWPNECHFRTVQNGESEYQNTSVLRFCIILI